MKVLSLNATNGGANLYQRFFNRLEVLERVFITLREMRTQPVHLWRRDLVERGYNVADSFEMADQFGKELDGRFRVDGHVSVLCQGRRLNARRGCSKVLS